MGARRAVLLSGWYFSLIDDLEETTTMFKLIACLFAASLLFAQVASAASDCESKAVSKAGKPLSGAAKTSFIKKCEADAKRGGASGTYTGVVSQQGRVKLDSDINEADDIGKRKKK
jgi:hypothetical protein